MNVVLAMFVECHHGRLSAFVMKCMNTIMNTILADLTSHFSRGYLPRLNTFPANWLLKTEPLCSKSCIFNFLCQDNYAWI